MESNMYLIGIVCAVFLGFIIFRSFRMILKIIINIIVGTIVLFVFNMIGSYFGIEININLITSFVTGFFGVPGVIILIIFKFI